MAGHSHRNTLKNGHKAFKSRHASKGSIKNRVKGKVEKETKAGKPIKNASKMERKNQAKQFRDQKILASLTTRKLFDGTHGAEKIITVIPLTADVYADDIVRKLLSSVLPDEPLIESPSVTSYRIAQFKSNIKVIIPDMTNFISILDAAKVADFVVFGLSGTSEVDPEFGEQIIRALEMQGIASYMGVVSNLSAVHPKEKFQLDVKQSLESYFKHFFPSEERIFNLEKTSEALNALRTLCQKFPRGITWRDSRGYLVADSASYEDDCLVVEGIVRGAGFNANRLVHLPGLGDFQVGQIVKDTAYTPDENQETLEQLAPQDLDYEEMDYDYDSLQAARFDDHGFLPGQRPDDDKVRLPKGTSDYQARWYLDDVLESDEESEPESDEEMEVEEEPEFEDVSDAETEFFTELSAEEEERQLMAYRNREEEDRDFPDEIELDPRESGRERLKKYRGLKNLHNCVWDVDEYDVDCPEVWKKLLRVHNWRATRNRVIKDAARNAHVVAGDRVKLYIRIPKNVCEHLASVSTVPLAIYSLLEHEHKMAVVNFSMQAWEDYEKPIPSGESIIVQFGIRRQVIQPMFSSGNHSPNNVHKYERFLHQGTASIATCIAPIDFTQAPAIFFKTTAQPGMIELVGHGSFLNADHSRIMAKRAVLTGDPFKIHKKLVTVRFMFFSPEDIEWFKSIPLFTKSGRTGFIKESLGTHGYFKATFDGRLTAQDVVAMSMYKRVWPKGSIAWTP